MLRNSRYLECACSSLLIELSFSELYPIVIHETHAQKMANEAGGKANFSFVDPDENIEASSFYWIVYMMKSSFVQLWLRLWSLMLGS